MSEEAEPVRVNLFIRPDVARAFRAACVVEGDSMSHVAAQLFSEYAAERVTTSERAATPKE